MGHVTVSRVILFGVSFGNNFPPQHPRIYRFRTRFSREANQIKIPTYAISLHFFFFHSHPLSSALPPDHGTPWSPAHFFRPVYRPAAAASTYGVCIIYNTLLCSRCRRHDFRCAEILRAGATGPRPCTGRTRAHGPSVRADPRTVHPENLWHSFKST